MNEDAAKKRRKGSLAKEIEDLLAYLSLEAFISDFAVSQTTFGPAVMRAREMGKGDIGRRAEAAWEAAAKLGNAEGQFQHGLTCYHEDKLAASQWWTRAAMSGHLAAQYWLGLQYYVGDGIQQDIESAIRFMTASAEQGNEIAEFVADCIREKTPEWLRFYLEYSIRENMDVGTLSLLIRCGDPADATPADLAELRKAIESGTRVHAARDRTQKKRDDEEPAG